MSTNSHHLAALALGLGCALLPAGLATAWISAAKSRLAEAEASGEDTPIAATAAAADVGYCTPELRRVLRRVLTSCGLVGADGSAGRGCQPADAASVATLAGDDFNKLFLPLADRAAIIQFGKNQADLEPEDIALVDQVFADRRGASWFLVVSRSSPEGSVALNRKLSEARARVITDHIHSTFPDPELDKQVGLLWLGEEYAQLSTDFCSWKRSGKADACSTDDLNRSAFLAWIDCRL
ncbi:MAG: hypothetical protein GXP62_00560 [Oligoflexia bacterium]|nr:hypothetical protein [Oligoflexia bacterium]